MVDASAIGVGTILVQADNKDQMHALSINCGIFTGSDRKLAKLYRELNAIVCTLKIYRFLLVGSKHPITFLNDHKPILSLLVRKRIKSPRFSRHQIVFIRFPKLVFLWTQGQKRFLADVLSGICFYQVITVSIKLEWNSSKLNRISRSFIQRSFQYSSKLLWY